MKNYICHTFLRFLSSVVHKTSLKCDKYIMNVSRVQASQSQEWKAGNLEKECEKGQHVMLCIRKPVQSWGPQIFLLFCFLFFFVFFFLFWGFFLATAVGEESFFS